MVDKAVPCELCGEVTYPSMKHLVVECSAFRSFRCQLDRFYGIPAGWWSAQPRVSVKSGWIAVGAASSVARRSQLQVAICRLGLVILEALGQSMRERTAVARLVV